MPTTILSRNKTPVAIAIYMYIPIDDLQVSFIDVTEALADITDIKLNSCELENEQL